MGEYADYCTDDGIAAMFSEDNDEYDLHDIPYIRLFWPLPYHFKRRRSAVDVFKDYRIPDKLE